MPRPLKLLEAVGTSRAVELAPEQRAALGDAIDVWADEARRGGQPEGIVELREAGLMPASYLRRIPRRGVGNHRA